MIFEATTGALRDAQLRIADIDGVVLATADQVQGRVIESMVTNGAAGGVGRDTTTLASAGEHAFVYACLRLYAGQGRRLLVVTWGKPSESADPDKVELVGAEPFLLRPLGMTETVAAGLQASAYFARYGLEEAELHRLRDRRAEGAARAHGVPVIDGNGATSNRLVVWPLTAADLPKPADAAAAMVLAWGEAIPDGAEPAWIRGLGWSTDRYDLGERDLTRFEALAAAARRAFADGEGARAADVVEVQEISTVAAFAACEALGLCGLGEGAAAATSAVVNPSGGNLPANPANAAGFLRFLAAAQQVRGRAGAVQVPRREPLVAIGAAMHGFAGQGAAVAVFGGAESPSEHQERGN